MNTDSDELTGRSQQRTGFTVWLTGLSGVGKTAIAQSLAAVLDRRGYAVEVLDGDEIREVLSPELGYSMADREHNIRRIGFVARLLSRNGVATIVAAISPSATARQHVRDLHEADFVEVHVDCPLPTLLNRDPKGLYAKALAGAISEFTGVSSPYERPENPDLYINTADHDLRDCIALILSELTRRGLTNGSMPYLD